MTFVCGPETSIIFPDVAAGACCLGSAVYGPQRCTCWEPVYDRRQRRALRTDLPPDVRPEGPCPDCAYSHDSPEQQGLEGYACNSTEELDTLVADGSVFWCHQGIRKPVRWRHPSGATVDGHPAAYDPPIADGVPYRANGHPANICAGWAARRRAYLASLQKAEASA